MSLVILKWPDARLRAPCPLAKGDVGALAVEMLETMYAAEGRGLAAPQVGVMARLFVMDHAWKEGEPRPVTCINPEILEASDRWVEMEEACLSIPGVTARVKRPEAIRLAWTTLAEERVIAELDGARARIAQHELDHLDGLVTFDRVGADQRAEMETAYGG